ncbi:MAG: VCBS repeat-containing protein [Phycisphaerae bacterium]|nr:VCBS repeat-containing protein [Phycisphaerae bacterium]
MKLYVRLLKSITLSLFMTTFVMAELPIQPGFNQVELTSLDGSTRAWALAMADFNNDLIGDIISGDTFGDIHLYYGDGDGNFIDQGIVINQAYHNAYSLAAADFNNDGYCDFALTMRDDYVATNIFSGEIHLYLGNGDGTFQSNGFPQSGLVVGDVGSGSMSITAGDVDGDNDIDIIASDITESDNNTADIVLYLNLGNNTSNQPEWSPGSILVSGQDLGYSPNPDLLPYYPPKIASSLHAYGLALGDLDGDNDIDLAVTDIASYLYIYQNDGNGAFTPISYNNISTGTRPYAYSRIHETFTSQLAITCGDVNGDGLTDIITGGCDGNWDGAITLLLNAGNNSNGYPQFNSSGEIGASGTDARGLSIGHINPLQDNSLDVIFGNYEGTITGLLSDTVDSDHDGIIDRNDNAPQHANAPRLDMNDDGAINYLDQLDNDQDGIGNPADDDDDNDGIDDINDNSPMVANSDQKDSDNDGRGDASDPLNNTDTDNDGIFDGPLDPYLYAKAKQAKAIWSQDDTHFIIRIDALGRVFQNEFTQTMTDAAIWAPAEWEIKKFENYNGIGDDPAIAGYQVPLDLPGGKSTPLTLVVIPRRIWNAYGDIDPISWINDRITNPNLEISQHGTYHANTVLNGNWADDPQVNWYSSEMCGFSLEEMYEYLRVGYNSLTGNYNDWWIQQAGADPLTSPKVDWSIAANPLISFAPPFNSSDSISRDAVSRLFMTGFSASIYEEEKLVFTPEGSQHEQFDQYGLYHGSADLQVDPESHGYPTYEDYLSNITQYGSLNTWLIEEVEWSTRYCNDTDRLEYCPSAPGDINRENNMIDLVRWEKWMTLLDFVNTHGQPMTLGDYSLAMAFDNAPTVANPDQIDTDHDGIGDVIDGAILQANDAIFQWDSQTANGILSATLTNQSAPITNQTIEFHLDTNADGSEENFTASTDINGYAEISVEIVLPTGQYSYTAKWDGQVIQLEDDGQITVPCDLSADLTGDCHVRLDDFAILSSQWLSIGMPENCSLSADIADEDCIVDQKDLAVMISQWLQ